MLVRSWMALLVGACFEVAPSNVLAQTEQSESIDESACFDAYENTQVLRKRGRLLEARQAAHTCQSDACPQELAQTCLQWEQELRGQIPSVIFAVRGPGGRDVTGASVAVDGQQLQEGLSGVPIELNPGRHEVLFSMPDGWQEQVELVVSPGEQNRPVTVVMQPTSRNEPPVTAPKPSRFTPIVITSASVGIAGFAAATAAAIGALSAKSELEACASEGTCNQAQVDRAKTWLLAGDIGLIVGGVGLTTALGFYIWGAPKSDRTQTGRNSTQQASSDAQVRIGLAPRWGGVMGGVEGTF